MSRLSGGEQARLLIARLMLQPADLLILDEPTNDLDIPTLEVLEDSLLEFPGHSCSSPMTAGCWIASRPYSWRWMALARGLVRRLCPVGNCAKSGSPGPDRERECRLSAIPVDKASGDPVRKDQKTKLSRAEGMEHDRREYPEG